MAVDINLCNTCVALKFQ